MYRKRFEEGFGGAIALGKPKASGGGDVLRGSSGGKN